MAYLFSILQTKEKTMSKIIEPDYMSDFVCIGEDMCCAG